jgi:hypothetical protein
MSTMAAKKKGPPKKRQGPRYDPPSDLAKKTGSRSGGTKHPTKTPGRKKGSGRPDTVTPE